MQIYGHVYLITNTPARGVYIGQTVEERAATRWVSGHLYRLRAGIHNNQYLQNTFNKYGENSFSFTVINSYCTKEELDAAEDQFINWYRGIGVKVYNHKTGGSHGRHDEETRKKIGEIGKGRVQSEETRAKVSIANKGKKRSPETCENIRKGKLGTIRTEQEKDTMSLARSGGKSYTITHEDGRVFTNVVNLAKFARDHGMSHGGFWNVLNGKAKTAKGWRIQLEV